MSATLYSVESWPQAWRGAFEPWLERCGTTAWQRRLPTALIVPGRPAALFAKSLAVNSGKASPGLRVLTPGVLRDVIRRHRGALKPSLAAEDFELLLAMAAESCTGVEAEAAAKDPAPLRKALEAGAAAGWPLPDVVESPLRAVVDQFERMLAAVGEKLPQQAAWDMAAEDADPRWMFSEVFILGFDAAHWQHWPSLRLAASLAGQATVCLRLPGADAASLDQVWIGTWEERFGEAIPLEPDGADSMPFSSLAEALSTGGTARSREIASARFLMGKNTTDQARLVVQQAAQFLAEPACERVEILVPGPGALARQIAGELTRQQIAHCDLIGHREPGPLQTPEFHAWLDFQEQPRLPALLSWLRAGKAPPRVFGGMDRRAIERGLKRAWEHTLFDDVHSLRSGCQTDGLKAALEGLVLLPGEEAPGSFVQVTARAFEVEGWRDHIAQLNRKAPAWFSKPGDRVSRRAFLRWLRAALDSRVSGASPRGREPFSRVLLVSLAEAGVECCSHLIVAGLNEGQWPPDEEDLAWLGEDAIATLNQRAAELNRQSIHQGRQGDGHTVVRDGRGLCLGAGSRRDLAWRDFLHAIATPSHGLALAAAAIDESAPDRTLNPSEFLNRVHFAVRGCALSAAAGASLAQSSHQWLEPRIQAPIPQTVSAPLLRAYHARRDASRAFGEFEFGFRSNPPRPLDLAATDWERAIKQPAQVWLAKCLGVESQDDPEANAAWKKSVGTWVHRWLSLIVQGGGFHPLPGGTNAVDRVDQAALEFRDGIKRMLQDQRRMMPDWWESTWAQARALARHFATQIDELPPTLFVATEWNLPATSLPHGARVHGKIDLLICQAPPIDGIFTDAWVVDYKTGSQKALSPGKLESKLLGGDGLQLVLYGLALQMLGAGSLKISRASVEASIGDGQLTQTEVNAHALAPLLSGLAHMQASGCFGMRGRFRDEFAHVDPLPLATLEPDQAILEAKWQLTHANLCKVGTEDPP